ncbi:MAG: hypothetical protein AAF573_15675, partial [Bacteroidota bacterium]
MEGFIDDLKDMIRKNGRVEELRQIAQLNGFRFEDREKFSVQDYLLKPFSVFKGKKDKRFKGILMKDIFPPDGKIRIYDYFYWGDFKTRKTTIFEVKIKALDLPKFEIRTKGILHQVSSFFIDNEKPYPEEKDFYTKYELLTPDPNHFEATVSPKLFDLILDRKDISVEGEGDYLLIYCTYQQTPAKAIMEEYDYVLDVVDVVLNDD